MADETQAALAQRIYDARAPTYDASLHPALASWTVSAVLRPQPGERILDLACGTGLVSVAAAAAVAPGGAVTAVDVSEGMLGVARARAAAAHVANVRFVAHDVADLQSCVELRGEEAAFDAVVCLSALFLLREPLEALRAWRRFLKPRGRIVTDVWHERFFPGGLCLEKVHKNLGLMPPYNRLWVKNKDSLKLVLGQSGFLVEESVLKPLGFGDSVTKTEDAEQVWESHISLERCTGLRKDEQTRETAKRMFIEEWKGYMDENGEFQAKDGAYIVRARSGDESTVMISGSCACGKVEWASKSLPGGLCFCHCISCRKASGGPFQAFLGFNTDDVTFVCSLGSKLDEVALSKSAIRGFCSNCGSSMMMQYHAVPAHTGVCAGSLDEKSVIGGVKLLEGLSTTHIFVKDKVSWYEIPDDGKERQQYMDSAEELLTYED